MLGHAIAFGALHEREARLQVERDPDVDRLGGDVGGAVIGEPLNGMRCAGGRKSSFDALDHEVADHLAGDAHGGRDQPMTSRSWQSKAKATLITSPFQQVNARLSEHQRILERRVRDPTIMFARPPATGVAGQKQTVLFMSR